MLRISTRAGMHLESLRQGFKAFSASQIAATLGCVNHNSNITMSLASSNRMEATHLASSTKACQ
jgi:hypothetical protein